MMNGRDVVIVAPQPWDFEIGSNARNIAVEFAKKNHVLYVNPPLDRKSSLLDSKNNGVRQYQKVIRKEENGLTKVQDNIWNLYPDFISNSINWIGIPILYDYLNERDTKFFANCILKACRGLRFQKIIVFNDNLIFKGLYLKEYLKPDAYVYYIRDYLVTQSYFKKHGVRLEPELIKKADSVVANSLYLKEYAETYNSNSFYVGQGCEIEMFDESLVDKIPDDLLGIERPIVGYVGFLTSMRLDVDLLSHIASSMPEWNLVLVGPEDSTFENSKLHYLQNVHFLGRKSPSDLPSYIKYFDVCINPQLTNELTIGNYPRKIDEYLAMGRPVVATKTKAMEVFAKHVYLATNVSEYIGFITKSLEENDESSTRSRILFARSHTWANSVNEIYKAIELAG